jgi:uncharacterized protein YndB with AHSA1/START domain
MNETPIASRLNVLRRALLYEPFEGGPGRVVRVEVEFEARPDRVWQAMTTPTPLTAWVGDVDGDLQEGGHFNVTDNASGRITRCEPGVALQADWDFGGSHSVVEARIAPYTRSSVLTLTNAMPDVDDEEWVTYGPGSAGVGWEMMLLALQHYLLTGQRFDDETWLRTANGRAAIHASSSAWAAVHVASGADERTAQASCDQTAAFYLSGV